MNCALNTEVKTAGRVAVLIPHHNDIAGLNLALASLANESVAVLIVDDGSATPPQEQLLHQAHPYLKSLHIIYLAENIGMAQALNVGLSYASDYDYIARLDCGDQSLAGRIATQKAFLDSHPQCHLVGSWAEYFNIESGKRYVNRYPSDHQNILAQMHRQNAFRDSATMYRRETVLALGGYPTKYKAAADYALFFAIAERYETANIPAVLSRCCTPKSSSPDIHDKARALSCLRILARHIRPGHIGPTMQSIARISAVLVFHLNTADAVNQQNYLQGDDGIDSYSGQAL
jgi:glycosyltransferase involved in cell wall biosynthesis